MPAPGVPAPGGGDDSVTGRLEDRVRRFWPLLFLLAFGLVWLLGLAVGHVVEAGRAVEVNDLDHRVWRRVVQVREHYPGLTAFFLLVTKVGDPPWASVLVVGSALGLAVLERRGRRPFGAWGAWFFLGVMIASQVLNRVLKAHFRRMRPEVLFRLVVEDSYSFPSGHALTSACFCGLWGWTVWKLVPRGKRSLRWVVVPPVLLLAWLVGASRVWIGVHYFNDVVGGLILGYSWAGLCLGLHGWLSPGSKANEGRV
jgi:undecaprenyl-diphosphatase